MASLTTGVVVHVGHMASAIYDARHKGVRVDLEQMREAAEAIARAEREDDERERAENASDGVAEIEQTEAEKDEARMGMLARAACEATMALYSRLKKGPDMRQAKEGEYDGTSLTGQVFATTGAPGMTVTVDPAKLPLLFPLHITGPCSYPAVNQITGSTPFLRALITMAAKAAEAAPVALFDALTGLPDEQLAAAARAIPVYASSGAEFYALIDVCCADAAACLTKRGAESKELASMLDGYTSILIDAYFAWAQSIEPGFMTFHETPCYFAPPEPRADWKRRRLSRAL
jgi:hypothetical protein